MKLDMCRGFGWICVDLGLSREIPQDQCYQDRETRRRELYTIREYEYRENKK